VGSYSCFVDVHPGLTFAGVLPSRLQPSNASYLALIAGEQQVIEVLSSEKACVCCNVASSTTCDKARPR
jgi:hypothetical protein